MHVRHAHSRSRTVGPRFLVLGLLWLAPGHLPAADFPGFAAQLPAQAELPDPLVMFDGQPVTSPEQWIRPAPARAEGTVPALHVRPDAPRPGERVVRDRPRGPRLPRRQGDLEGGHDHLRPAGTSRRSTCCWWSRTRGRGPGPVFLGIELPRQSRGGRRPEGRPADGVGARALSGREGQSGDRRRPGRAGRRLGGRRGDRPRLRPGDVLLRRRRPRPSGARRRRLSPLPEARRRRSRARTTGGRSPPGRGGCRGPSITS